MDKETKEKVESLLKQIKKEINDGSVMLMSDSKQKDLDNPNLFLFIC